MNARERVQATINHRQPDRVPVDLDATSLTGISASSLYKLRKYLGLLERPIVVRDIFQMLGVVDDDVRKIVKPDVVGLFGPYNFFGVRDNGKYKSFEMFDGTPTLQYEANVFKTDDEGRILVYPQGDDTVEPSAVMPVGGYFFDNIDRTPEYDEENLDPDGDFAEMFGVMTEEDAKYYERESYRLYNETDCAVFGSIGGGALGDVALMPGPKEKHPKGIRKMEDWLMAHILYPDYVKRVYELQVESAIKNWEIYKQAVGDRVDVIMVSGTDFGTQNGPFLSPDLFKSIYKPFYKQMNDWIHQNTSWKNFYHSCGSIVDYLDDFVEMGVDIINPVQLSAAGMDAKMLKEKYGDKLVFWGGGVDTQHMLPFGRPEDIAEEVKYRMSVLSKGGGFVFATIHNIVANVPPENIMAMYNAVHEYNGEHVG